MQDERSFDTQKSLGYDWKAPWKKLPISDQMGDQNRPSPDLAPYFDKNDD